MKIIILIKLFVLCIQNISCNDGLLSKFHQNAYKIRDVRMQKLRHNEKYFYFLEVKTFKYNRTTPAINVTAKFKISVKDKAEALIQGYKFLSNEYRHFPIRYQVNLKKAVDSDMIGLSVVKTCGNTENMTYEKDMTYTMCNFVPDASRCPPHIPNGRYKFDVYFLYLDDEIALLELFIEVYTPISIPKQQKLPKSN